MHNFNIIRKSTEFAGRTVSLETGRMAKQANGSVFLVYGGTSMLATATCSKEKSEGTDFFPLTVDYIEKMYASGKIPGGFIKRESKPSTAAVLQARLIDRSIRPLFPDGFRNQVHVVITVLSYDDENNPGILGILAASAALSISDIPFNGPIAGASVGLVDDELIIFPTTQQMEKSKLDLSVAGSENSIVMIESGAFEVDEDTMVTAVYKAHDYIKELITLQKEFALEAGKEKIEIALDIIPEEIITDMNSKYAEAIKTAMQVKGKLEKYEAFDKLKEEIINHYAETLPEAEYSEKKRHLKNAYDQLLCKYFREDILHNNHRADGRTMDEIRPITSEIDVLPIVHGSSLFTRGETQSLCVITLGVGTDEQVIDGLEREYKKNYFLRYNFPPFSVGEAGAMRAPGRRELGHGDLAERALAPVIPTKEEFPYTIRIVSEILESNGSSSMATVCSGTLALMAAGVPIKKPVAGISVGLILEGSEFVLPTDIMGLEDHLGDMDFKVTGTVDGITAMQLDIKIEGITREIIEITMEKAKKGRLYLLDLMAKTIAEPRNDLSPTAPRIEMIMIPNDKIGEVIGPGGKQIKKIIEETGVQIDIDDTGKVLIASSNKESQDKAINMIRGITETPEVGAIYEGTVTRIEAYGIFVRFMYGFKEGLVHISNIHTARVEKLNEYFKLGDKVRIRYTGLDKGKIALSMRGVDGNPEPPAQCLSTRSSSNQEGEERKDDRPSYRDRDRRDSGRGDHDRNSYDRRKPGGFNRKRDE